MADAPWRCSQCGTVNEPVANACRTCGRWPSLFELEGSTVEADAPGAVDFDDYAPEPLEPERLEPEVYDPVGEVELPPELQPVEEEDTGPPKPLWQRLASLIVPIGVVLYIVISAIAGNDGS